jgi:hypothetical protein
VAQQLLHDMHKVRISKKIHRSERELLKEWQGLRDEYFMALPDSSKYEEWSHFAFEKIANELKKIN